jgi:hypothetical protein
LRRQVNAAMSNKPVNQQEYDRLTRARNLLAERNRRAVLH